MIFVSQLLHTHGELHVLMLTVHTTNLFTCRLRLVPQMMVDVSNVFLQTTLLGNKIQFPICIAPTSQQKLAHPLGEMATAKGRKTHSLVFA